MSNPYDIEFFWDPVCPFAWITSRWVTKVSVQTGHRGCKHPDWIGLMIRITADDGTLVRAAFSFVRHNAHNQTILRSLAGEQEELEQLRRLSSRFSTTLRVEGDEVVVWSTPSG